MPTNPNGGCEQKYGCHSTCTQGCGSACVGGTSCSGACNCSGFCTYGCYNGCAHLCKGTCKGNCGGCDNSCSSTCKGYCDSTCKGDCDSSCYGGCDTTCNTTCTKTCADSCNNGCKNSCENTCKNTCENTCKNTCTDACTGCKATCKTLCNETCTSTTQKNNYKAVIAMSDTIKYNEANTLRNFINNELTRRGKTPTTISNLTLNQTADASWWNAIIGNINKVLDSSDDRSRVTANTSIIDKDERDAVIDLAVELYEELVPVD